MEARTVDYGGIGWAMNAIRSGHPVRRRDWPDGMRLCYVEAQAPAQAYVALILPDGSSTPWACTNNDVLATDYDYAGGKAGGAFLDEVLQV